ncbi:hypothetical protein, partial [Halochromatium sp.]
EAAAARSIGLECLPSVPLPRTEEHPGYTDSNPVGSNPLPTRPFHNCPLSCAGPTAVQCST